jgi:hypothetical protein
MPPSAARAFFSPRSSRRPRRRVKQVSTFTYVPPPQIARFWAIWGGGRRPVGLPRGSDTFFPMEISFPRSSRRPRRRAEQSSLSSARDFFYVPPPQIARFWAIWGGGRRPVGLPHGSDTFFPMEISFPRSSRRPRRRAKQSSLSSARDFLLRSSSPNQPAPPRGARFWAIWPVPR